MKKLVFLCFFSVIAAVPVFAQQLPLYQNIRFTAPADYKANEPAVLQAANYILTTPTQVGDTARLKLVAFVTTWMYGTPNHTFVITDQPTRYFLNDVDLMGLYMASLCKAALEKHIDEQNQLIIAGTGIFLDYISNPAYYRQKLSKDLKKLVQANESDKLESYMRL